MRSILILLVLLSGFCVIAEGKAESNLELLTGAWSKKAPNRMDWNDAKAYCANLNEGGYSDWRLPTISELRTLIQNCPVTETGGACKVTSECLSLNNCGNGGCRCIISSDGRYSKFGDTEWLLSSSGLSDDADYAWGVLFKNGHVAEDAKGNYGYVRCVRSENIGGGKEKNGRDLISQEKKVEKAEASLKTSAGNWSNKSSDSMNWGDAKAYCADLNESGYSDWRLPTISDLRTLIQNCPATETGGVCKVDSNCLWSSCRSDACIGCSGSSDEKYSKLGDTGWFWSSSEGSVDADRAWRVGFSRGGVYLSTKDDPNYVRCVRGENIGGGKEQNGKDLIFQEKKVEKAAVSLKTSAGNWSKKAPNEMNWSDAKEYCDSLNEGGFSNWRLPTISELRTLIQNCPETETGGACKIGDWGYNSGFDAACRGCPSSPDGKYSKLGDADWFWSSSEPTGRTDCALLVAFGHGGVDFYGVNESNNVRCVR